MKEGGIVPDRKKILKNCEWPKPRGIKRKKNTKKRRKESGEADESKTT